jgi:hypothetical protein
MKWTMTVALWREHAGAIERALRMVALRSRLDWVTL